MSEMERRDDAATQEPVSSKPTQEKAKTPAAKKKDKKPNRLVRWLKDMKGELKKVTWPSGKDTMRNVGTVILCVIAVGVIIGLFDLVARQVVDALLNVFH